MSVLIEVKSWNLLIEKPGLSWPQEMDGEEDRSRPLETVPVMHLF
jgi:hypothetical protein